MGAGALIAVCGLVAAACGSAPAGTGKATHPSSVAAPTPLATSVETATGEWATLPMGHLDQPLNTFWQLFVLRPGAAGWTDVTSFDVGTNGGLVLASNDDRTLLVGVRPTNLLAYSPLAATSSDGRSWSPVVPVGGLTSHTDALAAAGDNRMALTETRNGEQVVVASGATGWSTLATEARLAVAPATRPCGVAGLSAVTYGEGAPLVGALCDRPGVAGILTYRNGEWRLDGPRLPASLDGGAVEVASPTGSRTGVSALLEVTGRSGVRVIAAFRSLASPQWRLTDPVSLAGGLRLVSFGPAGVGYFVLSSSRHGDEQLDVTRGPGDPWSVLPAPPAATATVAFSSGGVVDAFVAKDSLLTVWSLAASKIWTKSQVIEVPIQYGSAS